MSCNFFKSCFLIPNFLAVCPSASPTICSIFLASALGKYLLITLKVFTAAGPKTAPVPAAIAASLGLTSP